MSFRDLQLIQPLLQALNKSGYKQPTAIQTKAIPRILSGKDIIAIAQTGTGKTAAFVLPVLQRLAENSHRKLPNILILAPVRELATQITVAIHKYSQELDIKVISILGGMPYHSQLRQLAKPCDIIVATPGRLIDYLNRGSIDLSQVTTFILDEADRMLDMGFFEDVKLISNYLPKKRQTLMFTATMGKEITQLAKTILHSPEHIEVTGESITLANIEQLLYITDDNNHKNQLLTYFLNTQSIYKAIVFSATKHNADKLAKQLHSLGHAVDALHGDIKQQKRNRILDQFRKGKINILIATDVAARGIDISDISHVINYDIPKTAEDYVHRIGRTGRAGKKGVAITFVLVKEALALKRIERFIGTTISQHHIAGLAPNTKIQSEERKPNKTRTRNRRHGKANSQNQERRRKKKGSNKREFSLPKDKPSHNKKRSPRRSKSLHKPPR